MPEYRRIFSFQGSDEEYMSYLERELLKSIRGITQRPNTPPSSVSTRDEELRILYYDPYTQKDRQDPVYCDIHNTLRGDHLQGSTRADGISGGVSPSLAPQGLRELRSFLRHVGTGTITSWEDRKREMSISSPSENRLAIQMLRGQAPGSFAYDQEFNSKSPTISHADNKELVRKGCNYGALGRLGEANGNMILLVAKFHQLIFVSYCSVMLHVGNSKETVDWMLRTYVSDLKPESLKRLRLGSIWVNRCVSELLKNGWGFRSWELFLLYPRSIQQYGRFAFTKDSQSEFVNSIGVLDPRLPIFQEGFIPYCIPCIIKVIAGDGLELKDICDCLGYDPELILLIYHNFFENADTIDFNPFLYAQNGASFGHDFTTFNPYEYARPGGC